jgi:putative ABC transport system permease protein
MATIIAAPVARYFMHRWLESFAYRISISAWYFIGAAGLALGIALVTVSGQAVKAAIANPVKSLRAD